MPPTKTEITLDAAEASRILRLVSGGVISLLSEEVKRKEPGRILLNVGNSGLSIDLSLLSRRAARRLRRVIFGTKSARH